MIKLLSALKAFKQDEQASPLVEFALISPILLLFVVGLADFSMLQNERMRLNTAARAGAQYALADSSDTAVISQVAIEATDLDPTLVTVTVALTFTCSEDTTTEYDAVVDSGYMCNETKAGYVTVTASETFSTLMNYPWLDNPYLLTGSAKIRLY